MEKKAAILVTGSGGMVGKALVKKLKEEGYDNLLLPGSKELDLKNQQQVEEYFSRNQIEYVFHLAAKVGGIAANIAAPGEYLYDNLLIAANVLEAAHRYNVKKLLYLGSSCIYPRECKQPMKEEYLLTGRLEPTNEGYALGKIAGLKLCEYYNKQYGTNFIALMPCNLYGENDHFDSERSHVVAALISKFEKACAEGLTEVEIWGDGSARREFLHIDDAASAMVYFMDKHDDANTLGPFVNIGLGKDVSIRELAYLIQEIVGFKGRIVFDASKPNGMPQKLLDVSRANSLGWRAQLSLEQGLRKTHGWYKENGKNSN